MGRDTNCVMRYLQRNQRLQTLKELETSPRPLSWGILYWYPSPYCNQQQCRHDTPSVSPMRKLPDALRSRPREPVPVHPAHLSAPASHRLDGQNVHFGVQLYIAAIRPNAGRVDPVLLQVPLCGPVVLRPASGSTLDRQARRLQPFQQSPPRRPSAALSPAPVPSSIPPAFGAGTPLLPRRRIVSAISVVQLMYYLSRFSSSVQPLSKYPLLAPVIIAPSEKEFVVYRGKIRP